MQFGEQMKDFLQGEGTIWQNISNFAIFCHIAIPIEGKWEHLAEIAAFY